MRVPRVSSKIEALLARIEALEAEVKALKAVSHEQQKVTPGQVLKMVQQAEAAKRFREQPPQYYVPQKIC